jgi:hypothetical protein
MVHVGLHSVETYHKKFGLQNKKIKICFFAECDGPDTRQTTSLASVTLGKVTDKGTR